MAKTLAAHYHGRVAYPKPPYEPKEPVLQGPRFAKSPGWPTPEPQNGKPLNNHKMESPEEIQSELEQTEQETN
jgi:hypothetical protein